MALISTLATVGKAITASIVNTIVGVVNSTGSTLMVPTVAGTGVTVSTLGRVTFTGSTGVSLNNCFTSAFKNYRLDIVVTAASASGAVVAVLRSGGADNVAGNYVYETLSGSATTAAAAASGAVTSWALAPSGITGYAALSADLYQPQIADLTLIGVGYKIRSSATTMTVGVMGGFHGLASSFDGLTFTSTSGTITGYATVTGSNAG